MSIKSRKEIRDERAEKVCREVRYQMSTHGGIVDNNILFELLNSWMKVATKIKYKRP